MKSKLSWFSFIPLTLTGIVLMVLVTYERLFVKGIYPYTDVDRYYTTYYFITAAVLLIFIVNIVFIAMDKKTSPAYILRKNIPAAVFAVLAAAMITSKSALELILSLQNKAFNMFVLVTNVFGFITAVCLVIIALSHLQGRNFLPNMGSLFLCMSIWGGLMLINEFLKNRIVSIYKLNPLTLFCYAFLMIFLFKLGMVIATVKGKNPVKSLYLYGLPFAAIGIVVGLSNVLYIIGAGIDYSENVIAFAFFSLALYVISFLVEITKYSLTNEEQVLKYDLDDFDEEQRVYGAFQDNTVVTPEEQTGDYDYDYSVVTGDADTYVTAADDNYTEDYDYDYSYGDGDKTEADDLVIAPDVEGEDDAIYVEKDKVETFEEGVVESNQENKVINEEVKVSEEDQKKIDDLLDDINS